ncbi:hypothetical protein E2C01_102091 [Portunus trituberculatus]|uniref:Uncharacterized protein n=1 Tax=Portunus trituberculatus TaxID=210409 RepID=A0A5B7KHM7_PORTR|nr:hypothetical protein [Portunus trituberculatus]
MEARPQVPLINKWAPRLLPTKRPSSITCPPTTQPQYHTKPTPLHPPSVQPLQNLAKPGPAATITIPSSR